MLITNTIGVITRRHSKFRFEIAAVVRKSRTRGDVTTVGDVRALRSPVALPTCVRLGRRRGRWKRTLPPTIFYTVYYNYSVRLLPGYRSVVLPFAERTPVVASTAPRLCQTTDKSFDVRYVVLRSKPDCVCPAETNNKYITLSCSTLILTCYYSPLLSPKLNWQKNTTTIYFWKSKIVHLTIFVAIVIPTNK